MSAVFNSPKQSIPAKIANSMADAPCWSEGSAAPFLRKVSTVSRRFFLIVLTRIHPPISKPIGFCLELLL